MQEAVRLACPTLRQYTAEQQCIAAAEAEQARKYFPVTTDLALDAAVMRNQTRVCRGEKIPKAKPGASCKLPVGYKPILLQPVLPPAAPAAKPRDGPAPAG